MVKIKRFDSIKSFGIFNEFEWAHEVIDNDDSVARFLDINLFYGRNYSGKTTLSRIVRALETETISDKVNNPQFVISLDDNRIIAQDCIEDSGVSCMVFNKDFIKTNLGFIYNSEETIKPFAILGADNNEIQLRIQELHNQLGSNKEGEKTGLHKEYTIAEKHLNQAKIAYHTEVTKLEKILRAEATGEEMSIKYQSEIYGDQNYTITKLKNEIDEVLLPQFTPLTNEQVSTLEQVAKQVELIEVDFRELPLLPTDLENRTILLTEKEITQTDKLEALLRDAILNDWVKKGKKLHDNDQSICKFCKSPITPERWKTILQHFDEEYTRFEVELTNLDSELEEYIKALRSVQIPEKRLFYSQLYSRYEVLNEELSIAIKTSIEVLEHFQKHIKNRIKSPLTKLVYSETSQELYDRNDLQEKLELLIKEHAAISTSLASERDKAKVKLRKNRVYLFSQTIQYSNFTNTIANLQTEQSEKLSSKNNILNKIKEIEEEVASCKRRMNDEEEGAKKVNEYLKGYFGNDFLTLEAIETGRDEDKQIHFEIKRENRTAFHLSEGENSLIAFCYFMALLETHEDKPIIWIDDPISSLDANHIFFTYSLIQSEVIEEDKFSQLFISTHNLNFFKYLKRLKGNQNAQKKYFHVIRKDGTSTIKILPKYLKEHVTEFNYLFEQIYNCHVIEELTDANYTIFYNFGNNARKFLELYCFYKYPDQSTHEEKLKKFFYDNEIPRLLTERVLNEYSHLAGLFERGESPVEVPEMKKCASLIIDRLKEDQDQFTALLRSIGISTEEE